MAEAKTNSNMYDMDINRHSCDDNPHCYSNTIVECSDDGSNLKQTGSPINHYNMSSLDECYWEKICDETLSMRSSIHSTADTSLSTKYNDIDIETTANEDVADSTFNANVVQLDTVQYIRGTFGHHAYVNGIHQTSVKDNNLNSSELKTYCSGNGNDGTRTVRIITNNSGTKGKCADLNNISKKRLNVLSTVLSVLMVSCCMGGILFLIYYMFGQQDYQT
jgi:hypothetical protein